MSSVSLKLAGVTALAAASLLRAGVVARTMPAVPVMVGERHGDRGWIVDGRPLMSEAAADLFHVEPGSNVTVATAGTGGRFKKFCAGETDISDASRPIKDGSRGVGPRGSSTPRWSSPTTACRWW